MTAMNRPLSPVAQSLENALAKPDAVLLFTPERLAEALRVSLRHLSPEAAQKISDVLSLPENPELAKTALTLPETAISRQFQLSVVDKTKTVNGVVRGAIEVQYVIPANIDLPTARADVNRACEAREDRSRPAIYIHDLNSYRDQAFEKGDDPAIERVVKFTIDFDTKYINMDGHRACAKDRNAHITPASLLSLGAALYYEQTGRDLMKDYAVRAVVSDNVHTPGVMLVTNQGYGVQQVKRFSTEASSDIVVALSPN